MKNKIRVRDQYLKENKCNEENCFNIISYNNWKYGGKKCRYHAMSQEIRTKISNFYKGKTGELCSAFKGGKPKCIVCGKEIWYSFKRCKSCSHKKELNGNWQGGVTEEGYSVDFNLELKESIRKRDNHTCQNCSMTEEEHLTVVGQVLHIHHIDYNKINCQKENLITLCQSCNSRANFNRDYWKKIYTEKINKMGNIKIK